MIARFACVCVGGGYGVSACFAGGSGTDAETDRQTDNISSVN